LNSVVLKLAEKFIPVKYKKEEMDETSYDYEYGNLNISMITKLDSKIKFGIAAAVFLIFIIFFYFGIKYITRGKEVNKKKLKNK